MLASSHGLHRYLFEVLEIFELDAADREDSNLMLKGMRIGF